ncbi:MAG TPA: four helix bundle protein, partial [Gemmatimonadales bacterium]|nr:four helix bundle protein [Gemmatimonadales bacterium]
SCASLAVLLVMAQRELHPRLQSRPPYERFQAWAACHSLTLAVYKASRSWPDSERFSLTVQARKAASSAAINIVEGAAQRGAKEFRRLLDISVGSLSELSYLLVLIRDLGYLPKETYGELEALRDHASRLTRGLHRAIAKRTPTV